jgi:hypothetical protein
VLPGRRENRNVFIYCDENVVTPDYSANGHGHSFCKKFSEPMASVSSLESYCDKLHILMTPHQLAC